MPHVPTDDVVPSEKMEAILGFSPAGLRIEQDAGMWVYQLNNTWRFWRWVDEYPGLAKRTA